MIDRWIITDIRNKITRFPAVGIIGSRQVGKTTLAKQIAKDSDAVYIDMENPLDLVQLDDPLRFFSDHSNQLILLDEIQRLPELFPVLRSVIDQNKEAGRKAGQFIVLGSASAKLLRQSSESLAGRIFYEELTPVNVLESAIPIAAHWLKGGYPDSLLAPTPEDSFEWRQAFISTYLERDIPFFGPRVPATTMYRFWTMLAHHQGMPFNASHLSKSLGTSVQTIFRYIDLMEDLFLVRKLRPWYRNTKKRLTKSPKVFIRDSGILHTLLNIHTGNTLHAHPVVGFSWEGFVLENIDSILSKGSALSYYRSAGGAEIDLIIEHTNGKIYAIEVKKSAVPSLERGFFEACKEIHPDEKMVIYQGDDEFYLRNDVLAIGLKGMMERLL